MDIYELLKNDIISNLTSIYKDLDFVSIKNLTVESPKNNQFGELSTNAAMVIAKVVKENPKDIAEKIKEQMQLIDYINSISVEGNGFINFILKKDIWYKALGYILTEKQDYGKNNIGRNTKVNLEFVSANPTGLLHIGHTRGAIYGDTLSNLLKFCGFDVTKEFYVNDAGGQIKVLADSAYIRYREFVENTKIPIPEGLYPGEYLIPTGKKLYEEFKNTLLNIDPNKRYEIISKRAIEDMIELIKQDLHDLNIVHDIFFSERILHSNNEIEDAINLLKSIELVYEGELEPPKGKLEKDWRSRKQLLFKSTKYGDDVDRPLQKSDGSWTYFASEIAYVQNKIKREFGSLIFIFGADHSGYVTRTKSIVSALSNNKIECEIKICQLVKFLQNGLPVKMSKRKGIFASVRDVLEEVGSDVIRFIMLTRKNDMDLEFDLEKSKEQSKDNPVFYVQYAHVRCFSLIEKTQLNYEKVELKNLTLDIEIDLIRFLTSFPHIIKSAALSKEPHRVVFYLINLASKFHSLWNHEENGKSYRFLIEDNQVSMSRIFLASCVKQVLANGLKIIGIDPINKM